MRALAALALLALAACGADGPPLRPGGSVGVGLGSDGVAVGDMVGATDGTFSVGLGF